MILPIHLLAMGDESEFGKDFVLLSYLHRLGFPVAKGFVVSPPHQEINHFLIDQNIKNLRDFETKYLSLQKMLQDHFVETHNLTESEKELLLLHWPEMVRRWVLQLQSHFTRYDNFTAKHLKLKSFPIYATSELTAQGIAEWDHFSEQIVIQLKSGELDHNYLAMIDDLVRRINKKLGFKYAVGFIVTADGVQIINLEETRHQLSQLQTGISNKVIKNKIKRKIKLYSTFAGNLVLDEEADGYFLDSVGFDSHDQKQVVLLETMIAKYPQIVLYQVSERFLKSDAAAIKLCRNLKKQDNLEIVLPFDENGEALFELKRTLASLGVTRKGKLKFWIRVGLPALAMQIEEVVLDDFDGIIFDTDLLAAALHGRDISDQVDQRDVTGLIRFLDPLMKQLSKKKLPVILIGSLINNEILIKQAISWQVAGLIVGQQAKQMDQTVSYHEHTISMGLV